MSEDQKLRKDEKKRRDIFPSDSSQSSCSSKITNETNLGSVDTPMDLLVFDLPVESLPVEIQPPQVRQSEVQGAGAGPSTIICARCKRHQCPSPLSDDTSQDRSCQANTPSKKVESKSSAMGAIQKQLKTFSVRKEEKKCLLESHSSEQISESVPLQPKNEPVLVDVGESKQRSYSLPIHVVPVDLSDHTPQKRTKSEGAVQPSAKPEKSESPKKKSPLKRVVAMFRQVVTRSKPRQDTEVGKPSDASAVSDTILELEKSGGRTENPEAGAAEAAAQSAETVTEKPEQRNDPGEETPRSSRHPSNLGDESSDSPAK